VELPELLVRTAEATVVAARLSGPTTLVARWRREWTCPIHDSYEGPDYDECGDEDDWHWPVYGCTCSEARWAPLVGQLEFVLESALSTILRECYLPAIREQLNRDVLLLGLLKGGCNELPEHPAG